MIIHHMADGTIRKDIEGVIVPKSFENIYILASKKRSKEYENVNNSKSRNIRKE